MTTIQSRIQHKRDTSSNWEQNNPVLLAGEIIIVDTNAGERRTKTGDGIKRYNELPFDDESVRNLVSSKDAETLQSAKAYTDEKIGSVDLSNVITATGGGQIQPDESIGVGPFIITMDEEVDDTIGAENLQFADGQTLQQKYDSGELVGPPGKDGNKGEAGPAGENATINGVSALTIEATGGINGTQIGNTFTIDATELFQSVSNGKSLIAGAITDKGVSTSADDTFQQMATNIEAIQSGAGYSVVIEKQYKIAATDSVEVTLQQAPKSLLAAYQYIDASKWGCLLQAAIAEEENQLSISGYYIDELNGTKGEATITANGNIVSGFKKMSSMYDYYVTVIYTA